MLAGQVRLPFKRQPSQQDDQRIAFSGYPERFSVICLGCKGNARI